VKRGPSRISGFADFGIKRRWMAGPSPEAGTLETHPVAGRAASGEPLARSRTRLLRRWNDRRVDCSPGKAERHRRHLTNLSCTIQGIEKAVTQIARELNVEAVVEGTVLRHQNRVRITAELIRASPEQHLWAHDYEGSGNEILTLRDTIAQAVARAAWIEGSPHEQVPTIRLLTAVWVRVLRQYRRKHAGDDISKPVRVGMPGNRARAATRG
jgi:hypothetical protein